MAGDLDHVHIVRRQVGALESADHCYWRLSTIATTAQRRQFTRQIHRRPHEKKCREGYRLNPPDRYPAGTPLNHRRSQPTPPVIRNPTPYGRPVGKGRPVDAAELPNRRAIPMHHRCITDDKPPVCDLQADAFLTVIVGAA